MNDLPNFDPGPGLELPLPKKPRRKPMKRVAKRAAMKRVPKKRAKPVLSAPKSNVAQALMSCAQVRNILSFLTKEERIAVLDQLRAEK